MDLAERLNLSLAWKRVKTDLKDVCWLDQPFELFLVESDLDNWLESLREKIATDTYNPSRCRIIDIPKPKWHLRPGGVLTLEDNVVYSAVLLDCIRKIEEGIGWSSNTIRFSNILKKDQDADKWCEFELNGWTKFREESLKAVDQEDSECVLFSDIAAFYENIDLQRLISDLESLCIPKENRDLLSKCLNRWSEPRGRGIPQGFKPSDILAEIYLNSIDKRLKNEGIIHLRYVDDSRIFCEKRGDTIESLHSLTRLYREKGLNLQTAKSVIKIKQDAINEINGVSQIISELKDDIIKEIKENYWWDNPYGTPKELRTIIESEKIGIYLKALTEAFNKYFLSEGYDFDKSLFHYIINRFGALRKPTAVAYSLKLILRYPEETKFVLDYFSYLPNPWKRKIAKFLSRFIERNWLTYEYQKFLIIKWIWKQDINLDPVLTTIRNLIRKAKIDEIRNYCIAYLGEYGDSADLDLIESLYSEMVGDQSKTTIICSLKNMSQSRRNSIYGRARGDGYLVDLAIRWARSQGKNQN